MRLTLCLVFLFFSSQLVNADEVARLKQLAEAGDVNAQHEIGLVYFWGKEVTIDRSEAARWFKISAKEGHSESQAILGDMYVWGDGVPKNRVAAIELLMTSIEQGNPAAMSSMAFLMTFEGRFEDAVNWFKQSAENGDVKALYNLGLRYEQGMGVKQDHEIARKYFLDAALLDDVDSQAKIGHMYWTGIGGEKNVIEAITWLRKAAEQGDATSAFWLALIYTGKDEGFRADNMKFAEWCRKAAELGHARAQYMLALAYRDGFGVAKDYVLSYMWANINSSQNSRDPKPAALREELESIMTQEQVAEAQSMSRDWLRKFNENKEASDLWAVTPGGPIKIPPSLSQSLREER